MPPLTPKGGIFLHLHTYPLWKIQEWQKQVKASEMPNDAKHHASVLACKDAQLGDSDVHTI